MCVCVCVCVHVCCCKFCFRFCVVLPFLLLLFDLLICAVCMRALCVCVVLCLFAFVCEVCFVKMHAGFYAINVDVSFV